MSDPQYPAPQQTPTPRERYRAIMAQRQMKVYGTLIAALAVALVLALLGLTGIMPSPFGNEFSKKTVYAKVGSTPCPSVDARPVASTAGIQLQVLNASSTPGLASSVGNSLEELGYTIALVGNSTDSFRGNVQIEANAADVDRAYTLARYFDHPVRIKLEQLPNGTMTIILGDAFSGFPTEDTIEAIRASQSYLVPLNECLPVDPASPSLTGDQQSGQSGQSE